MPLPGIDTGGGGFSGSSGTGAQDNQSSFGSFFDSKTENRFAGDFIINGKPSALTMGIIAAAVVAVLVLLRK